MRVLLSLFLLSMSTSALANERTGQQSDDWDEQLEMLRAVPYIGFSEDIVAESDTGVVLYDAGKSCDGYNFYCASSAGRALLLDMYGRVVHRWTWLPTEGKGDYDYAILLDNRDLVVLKNNRSLFRLSWDSELIWQKALVAHHDVAMAPDGSFYVLVRETRAHRWLRGLFDAIVHLRATGEEIDRWSTYDHFDGIKSVLETNVLLNLGTKFLADDVTDGSSQVEEWQRAMKVHEGKKAMPPQTLLDLFHMNTVGVLPATVLGERDSRFQCGNLLVCFRNLNQIAVLEKGTYRVLWAWGDGKLEHPHHPTMLENGHILIFDNGIGRKYSRIVELDPISEVIVWEYMAEPPEVFYSRRRGSSQRLVNGNTLICESDNGRVFEVTEQGELVWVWLNPVIRDGHREAVYRMMRLPSAWVDEMLRRWWWE